VGLRRLAIVETLLVATALAATIGLLAPSPATPEGKIVIRGASSGSHLKLSVRGDQIIVKGHMSRRRPTGCTFVKGRKLAVCPAAGVGRIAVDMGPSDDKVEVLNRLPFPLTTRMGRGSDKLIANGEQDTCYPQGSKRNRCYGFGGNDVCITGDRNSDCVGGRGDDYCKHGDGSDGCWGGPGNDVCVMGAGQDGCHGGPGNDRLYGGPDPDQLYGGPGRDFCSGGPGIGHSHGCEEGPGH
jgi:hypothetical protein